MTITAKYAGSCAACGGPINVGDRINWTKGEKPTHASCPAPSATAGSSQEYPPTAEQQVAIDLAKTGESIAIMAGAGTGKTSTLIFIAEEMQRARKRGVYLAFNRKIVQESRSKFPANVTCSTAHAMAWQALAKPFKERKERSRRMKSIEIARVLGVDAINVEGKTIGAGFLSGLVMATIGEFCKTADAEPGTGHVPFVEGLLKTREDGSTDYSLLDYVRGAIQPYVKAAWRDITTPSGRLPFGFDHFLKMWQLDPGARIHADFILFDEAQDANPVMVDVVARQKGHAQLIWVGDSQQQIYAFTGAINALDHVPADKRAYLTQSFRFGPAVAEVANVILDELDADLRLKGFEKIESVVESVEQPKAILCRTNAVAVRTVLGEQASGRTVALVGGGQEVLRFAEAADELITVGATEHPDLACFDSWAEVVQYVEEDEQGKELELLVKLVEDFGVETIREALGRKVREEDADVIVSTAHKAKGCEWESVQLAGDFPPRAKMGAEEKRLLYVAVTRAQVRLDVTMVDMLSEYFFAPTQEAGPLDSAGTVSTPDEWYTSREEAERASAERARARAAEARAVKEANV